ncbi:perlucin-like protein [Mytilus trossulus]|uniref:perlucin-like protein n=1 Tax=Mytilus trossulus TaxID=6551 RepID=UPI0030068BB7
MYLYDCYYFSKDQKNWTDAKSSCQSKASMLAEVVSSDQRDFLKTKAEENRYTFWLGGTDIVTESVWMWTTSQTTFTFTDWHPNNPSNDDGNENCLEMRQSVDFLWNDNFCYHTNNYICQRPYI